MDKRDLNELNNLEEVQKRYGKLRKIFEGKEIKLEQDDKKYLKRIEVNNYLMTILNIVEAVEGGINDTTNAGKEIEQELKAIFKDFFGSSGIIISNEQELNGYLRLFRNNIAHHSDYYINFFNEDLKSITFKKNSKKTQKNINFDISVEELSNLANSLLKIFKDNHAVQSYFSGGIRLNNIIENVLNDEQNLEYLKKTEDLDLSYRFYISSLFEMIKYKIGNSISSIANKKELLKMLYGLKEEMTEKDPINISNILEYSETIESMILFYYNAHPNDEIFNEITYNNKSSQQLLDEYSIKIAENLKEETDFEKLIKNYDNSPYIQKLKEKIVEHYFLNLPEINRLYFGDDSIELMPSIKLLLDGFESKSDDKDEIIYWTNPELASEDNALDRTKLMNKIRNAVIHGRTDICYIKKNDGTEEPIYSFQDSKDNNMNFIITHITSLQLQKMLSESAKILKKTRGFIPSKEKDDTEKLN